MIKIKATTPEKAKTLVQNILHELNSDINRFPQSLIELEERFPCGGCNRVVEEMFLANELTKDQVKILNNYLDSPRLSRFYTPDHFLNDPKCTEEDFCEWN